MSTAPALDGQRAQLCQRSSSSSSSSRHSTGSPAGRKDACRNNPCGNRHNLPCAIVATLFAASIPNRVRQHLDELDRRHGVIALDHQFASARTLFIGAVLNDDRKARAGPQLRREGIVQQPPVPAPAPEAHAGHVEGAVARIADREGAIRAAPRVHAAESRRAGDCQLTGRRVAGDIDADGARGIVARDCDRRGLWRRSRGA